MPNPVLQQLTDEVAEEVTVMASAKTLIDGFAQRLTDAVAAALANGATEAELAPLNTLVADLNSGGDALAAAVAANTPAAP